MANKTLNSSSGYFNKEMLAILKKGEAKTANKSTSTAAKKKSTAKKK